MLGMKRPAAAFLPDTSHDTQPVDGGGCDVTCETGETCAPVQSDVELDYLLIPLLPMDDIPDDGAPGVLEPADGASYEGTDVVLVADNAASDDGTREYLEPADAASAEGTLGVVADNRAIDKETLGVLEHAYAASADEDTLQGDEIASSYYECSRTLTLPGTSHLVREGLRYRLNKPRDPGDFFNNGSRTPPSSQDSADFKQETSCRPLYKDSLEAELTRQG